MRASCWSRAWTRATRGVRRRRPSCSRQATISRPLRASGARQSPGPGQCGPRGTNLDPARAGRVSVARWPDGERNQCAAVAPHDATHRGARRDRNRKLRLSIRWSKVRILRGPPPSGKGFRAWVRASDLRFGRCRRTIGQEGVTQAQSPLLPLRSAVSRCRRRVG
jgi:hypothetical protein